MGIVINTNMSSLTAQRQLDKTSNQLGKTMERISSGLKVNSAKDGGAKYASANALKNTYAIAKSALDSLSGGKALVDNTLAATSEVLGVLNKMQELVSVDDTQQANAKMIDNDLNGLVDIISAAITNASHAGANLMTKDAGENFTFLQGTDNTQTASNTLVISGLGLGNAGVSDMSALFGSESGLFTQADGYDSSTGLTAAVTAGDFAAKSQQLKEDISAAITKLSDFSSTLGATAVRIETQITVTNTFMESNQQALSDIADADMGAESSAMKGLETRKQLGITALSTANKASEMILKLVQ
jgi:flagellin